MSSFEEQFPSLRNRYSSIDPVCIVIDKEDVEKYTIDKQQVKEAILKELEDWRDDLTNWNKEEIPVDFANCLLRRLELEDLK